MFVMALLGTTVGFGNIWRFPYLAGEQGGAAFLSVYLASMGLIGLPLMVVELFLGRRGRRGPVTSIRETALEQGRHPMWGMLGIVGLLAGCMLLAAYSVVGGWSMAYVFRAASGAFAELDSVSVARLFRALISDPERLIAWHTLFLGATILIVSRGLRFGLEPAVRWFLPVLVGCLLLMLVRGHATVGLGEAANFMFALNWQALDHGVVLTAMGHAFFSLTLGVGAITAFGRYAAPSVHLARVATLVVLLDVAVSMLAGMAMFPFVFAADLSPASGPGLLFQTFPLALSDLPGGRYIGVVFFAMLTLAAWSSAIALLEAPVAWLVERFHMERGLAASVVGILVWLLGLVVILSFNLLAHIQVFPGWPGARGKTLFEGMTYLATNLMLPSVGLGIALFVGWLVSAHTLRLDLGGNYSYRIGLILIRFVTPAAMLIVGLHASGILTQLADWTAL